MFCRKCGNEMPDDSLFCQYCGAKVEDISDTTAFEQEVSNEPKAIGHKGKYISIGAAVACAVVLTVGLICFMLSKSNDDKIQTDDSSSKVYNQTESTSVQKSEMPDETSAVEVTTTEAEKNEPAKEKQSEIIPATELVGMTYAELLSIIGDDYYGSKTFDRPMERWWGIRSDKYFPNVLIRIECTEYDEASVAQFFEEHDNVITAVWVEDGGLIGNGIKVGMNYKDVAAKADCIKGVLYGPERDDFYQSLGVGSFGIVDNLDVSFDFDYDDRLPKLYDKYNSSIIDLADSDSLCIHASVSSYDSSEDWISATVIKDDAVLLNATHSAASEICRINKGEQIYLKNTAELKGDGENWYEVSAYYTIAIQQIINHSSMKKTSHCNRKQKL